MSIIDKIKDLYKQSPLAVVIVGSAVVLSIIGFFVLIIKGNYKPSMTKPPVVGVFGGSAKDVVAGDDIPDIPDIPDLPDGPDLPDIYGTPSNAPTAAVTGDAEPTTPADPANPSDPADPGNPTEEPTPTIEATPTPDPNAGIPVQYIDIPVVKPRSSSYKSTGKKALTTAYDWITVDKDWFSDAVCIGDSRVEDFCLFSKIGMDCFYARGLTIFHLMDNKVIDKKGNDTTVTKAFQEKQYKKIYICEGLNECGYASTEDYYKHYNATIEKIKQLQPNAIIYIMSTMYVTKRVSDKNDSMNNDNVNDKNAAVAALSNGKDIFYIDINDANTTDENGALNPDDTEDGEHLAARSVWKWDEYLKAHAVRDDTLK